MSDTPRTDAALHAVHYGTNRYSFPEHARTLERELATEREKVRKLRAALIRRHDEQSYFAKYVDDVLAETEDVT